MSKARKKFLKLLKGQRAEFPNSPQLHEIAGHTFRSEGDFHKAESHFNFVFQSDRNRLASYINLAVVLLELEKFGEAIDCLNKGRVLFPDEYRIYYNLGVGYTGEGLYEEAIAFYLKALALNDNFFDAYINLANAYSELGRIDLSIETTEKILALNPERYEVYYNLGHYSKILGDLERAKLAFTKALEINPRCASSHHGLATLTKYDTYSDHLRALENLASSKSIERDQELIHFSLAKAYEDLGDNKKSFTHYLEANKIRKRKNNYNHSHQARLLDNIKENTKFLQSVSPFSQDEEGSPTPIFIIGMPRSGTTLVEQIVSSHSLIAPAGELSSVQLFNGLLAEEKVHISELQLNLFKKSYFRELEQYRDKEKYVTDKLPHNFMSVALIRTIFPESPIIHVKRDPRAVCWSNFKTAFTKNSLKYSTCLENIVDFYKGYEDLMNFWFKKYPNKIHTIDYENLVINPENETKRLISFIGIDWENACLQPHKNKRSVKTASQSQVREKIYSGSSKEWEKFEPYLNSVFDELAAYKS